MKKLILALIIAAQAGLTFATVELNGEYDLMAQDYGTNTVEMNSFYLNFKSESVVELTVTANGFTLPCEVSNSEEEIQKINETSPLISADAVILCETQYENGEKRKFRYSLEKVKTDKYIVFEVLGEDHLDEMFFLIKR